MVERLGVLSARVSARVQRGARVSIVERDAARPRGRKTEASLRRSNRACSAGSARASKLAWRMEIGNHS